MTRNTSVLYFSELISDCQQSCINTMAVKKVDGAGGWTRGQMVVYTRWYVHQEFKATIM